jgi:hypothetical protein
VVITGSGVVWSSRAHDDGAGMTAVAGTTRVWARRGHSAVLVAERAEKVCGVACGVEVEQAGELEIGDEEVGTVSARFKFV